MVKKGATTWWERWNGDTGDPSMNSYNHYAFGAVMAWVYQRAAGIDTDPTGPGFHRLIIHPHFDPLLQRLHVEYDSAYGTIVSDWQQNLHRFTITLPANTTATITLPNSKSEKIGSGQHVYYINIEPPEKFENRGSSPYGMLSRSTAPDERIPHSGASNNQ